MLTAGFFFGIKEGAGMKQALPKNCRAKTKTGASLVHYHKAGGTNARNGFVSANELLIWACTPQYFSLIRKDLSWFVMLFTVLKCLSFPSNRWVISCDHPSKGAYRFHGRSFLIHSNRVCCCTVCRCVACWNAPFLHGHSFWFLVFVSFFPFLSSLLLFHERNNMQIFNYKVFHSSILPLFFGFPVLSSLSNTFFLSLFFMILRYVFVFQNKQVFWCLVKRGVATKRLFYQSVFSKMWTVMVFRPFFGKFWLKFKKHDKIGISAHFPKQKTAKMTIFKRHYLGQVNGYYLGQVGVQIKSQLGPDNNY